MQESGVTVFSGGEVLLRSDRSLAVVAGALGIAARAARRDGIGLPADVAELVQALKLGLARMSSVSGTSEFRTEADWEDSEAEELVTTQEAAQLMKTTERNVRALCQRGSLVTARRIGRRWVMDRADVLGRQSERAS